MKKVIDGDNMKVVETFEESKTQEVIKKYEAMGLWADVSVDRDGDIILWEE